MNAKKVLIVEDDKDSQILARDILDLDGFYTCIASQGRQAVEIVRGENGY